MSDSRFIERDKIELNDSQTKMIISGWGKDVYENTIVEKITYLSDGLKIKGYLAFPKKNEVKKFPCIIWNRGGYENKGAIDKFTARGIYGQIASWGYVVFASQYRGNAGSEGKEELGGSDVNDILNLMPLADELPFADKGKRGIEGWSRGGMMTYLTLLKNPNFLCAVLVGAISDFKNYVMSSDNRNSIYKKIIEEKDFEKKLEERTIINFAEKLPKIPYLLMHGKSDETVPVEQTIDIAKKFDELSFIYKLKLFEGGDHYLKKHRKEVDELRRMWFEKYLKDSNYIKKLSGSY
jgi:dipeptidyl aminopeptidase/acylaminoacyl peptidase